MSENISPPSADDDWNPAATAVTDVPDRPAPGGARKAVGKVQAGIDKVATQLSGGVAKATERSVTMAERTADRARRMAGTVEPFVRGRPFMSSGLALGVGMLLGLLVASRGPRVIYIKTRPSD
jgi:ElaB/YqjD/DUF883 family membrane-anchored ribosome-binding protein